MSVVNLIPIFPTLVYDIECEYLLNEVLKIFDRVEWNKDNPKVSKNHNVLSKNKNLVKKIEVIINETLSDIGYNLPFKMTTSWFTCTQQNQRVEKHYHTNSLWSGVFYFQEHCSPLIFETKVPQINVFSKPKNLDLVMHGSIGFSAKFGHMILFPSYVDHYTDLNNTLENRYSLAMNFMPNGLSSPSESSDSSYYYR